MSTRRGQVSPQLLYEEKTPSARMRHYCLKPVKLVETKATKDEQSVNIQFTRDSKTSVQVDNVREKKFQEHFNFMASRLQKLHKNMMWSMYVGRSFLDNIELVTKAQDEFVSTKLLLGAKTLLTILRICSD